MMQREKAAGAVLRAWGCCHKAARDQTRAVRGPACALTLQAGLDPQRLCRCQDVCKQTGGAAWLCEGRGACTASPEMRRALGDGWGPTLPRPDAPRAPAGLRGRLPGWVNLPPSVTVPFGACEEALAARANTGLRKQLEAAVSAIPDTHAEDALAACRELVMQVPQLCQL